LGKLLRHISNIVCVLIGLGLIKFGLWVLDISVTGFCVVLGLTFVYVGLEDYINAIRKWLEERRKAREEQERRERLKRLLEEEERRREEQRKKTAMLFKFIEKPIKFPEIKVETTGEILKRLGIKREKKRKPKPPKKKIEIKKPKPEKPKYSTLEPLIQDLLSKGELYIDRNMHWGKLRGKDIARALKRELKRRGIEFEVKYGDYDATVKIKRR